MTAEEIAAKEQAQSDLTLNEKFRVTETKATFGTWIKKRMGWIVVIGASALFVFKEGLDFSRTGDDIVTIILGMALTYLFTIYISISLRNMGKKSGKESATFISALTYMSSSKKDIKEILYLLPRFCKYKNETTLEEVKMLFIEENGLSHDLWLKGYYNNDGIKETLTDKELDALKEVTEIKITMLSPSGLLTEHSKSKSKHQDPLYLGVSELENTKKSTKMMAVTKLLLPLITGYMAVQVVLGQNLIWGAIQVGIILLMGITHYMEGEDYITSELKNRYLGKANFLIEFKNLFDNKNDIFKVEQEVMKELDEKLETEPEVQEIAKDNKGIHRELQPT